MLFHAGGHTIGELEELFAATYSTIYRAIARARAGKPTTNSES